jgi:hypothetical protein
MDPSAWTIGFTSGMFNNVLVSFATSTILLFLTIVAAHFLQPLQWRKLLREKWWAICVSVILFYLFTVGLSRLVVSARGLEPELLAALSPTDTVRPDGVTPLVATPWNLPLITPTPPPTIISMLTPTSAQTLTSNNSLLPSPSPPLLPLPSPCFDNYGFDIKLLASDIKIVNQAPLLIEIRLKAGHHHLYPEYEILLKQVEPSMSEWQPIKRAQTCKFSETYCASNEFIISERLEYQEWLREMFTPGNTLLVLVKFIKPNRADYLPPETIEKDCAVRIRIR